MRKELCYYFLLLCLFLLTFQTGYAQIFEEVPDSTSVVVSHFYDSAVNALPFGSGAAWGDIDNDSRIDLYVTQLDKDTTVTSGRNYLFLNNGDNTFTDITVSAGVEATGTRSTACTFVDYDNDGDLDLFVANDGQNILYRNNNTNTFTDVTLTAFLSTELDTGFTTSIAWGDYDMDGDLDLFYTNHQTDPLSITDPQRADRLFRNNGDGTFTDVSSFLGTEAKLTYGFASGWWDYDLDGDVDLLLVTDCPFTGVGGLTEDQRDNKLWRNDGSDGAGGWTFTEVADTILPDSCKSAKGLAIGDYNNDGYFDFAFSNNGSLGLFKSNTATSFTDEAVPAGVEFSTTTNIDGLNSVTTVSWGTEFFDYDNDGLLDLYVVAGDYTGTAPMANGLFKNAGGGTFTDQFTAADTTFDDGKGRTIAVADYDKDGYLDYYLVNLGGEGKLMRNLQSTVGNRWLRVELDGTVSNEHGVGARIVAKDFGTGTQVREIRNGSGYGAGTEIAAYFGFGSTSGGDVDSVFVYWPSGIIDTLTAEGVDRRIVVVEPGIANILDLTATNSDTAISLTWGAKVAAKHYNLFRGTEAYFDTTGNLLVSIDSTDYEDMDTSLNNVLADPDTNYFYKITASGGRFETDTSNVVGELDYALTAGFNFIALPLTAPGFADAEGLGLSIDAQVGGAGASAIYQMVGGSWQLMAFKLAGAWIVTVADPLVVGKAYLVNMDVAGTWTIVGGLEPDLVNSLNVDFNTIMLPFKKAADEVITDAEGIGLSIDALAAADGATAIYQMVSGSWQLMAFKLAGAWIVTVPDAVVPGHSFLVNMSESLDW